MSQTRDTLRRMPNGAFAAGTGTACKKWAVKLVQKSNAKGKYSPSGTAKGMQGIPYEITIDGKVDKSLLDNNGQSKIYTTQQIPSVESLNVKFGLKILPDYSTLDLTTVKESSLEVGQRIGGKIKLFENKCAVRLSFALNAGKSGKYVINSSHKIQNINGITYHGEGAYSNDYYFVSSPLTGDYITKQYPHTPMETSMQSVKAARANVPLNYKKAYSSYGKDFKALYRLKCLGWDDAVGHVDVFSHPEGYKKLIDYATRGEPSEFYIWIFTKIIHTGSSTNKSNITVFNFEHIEY